MPNLLLKSAGILLVAALVAFAGLLFSMPELSAQEADSDGEPAATPTPVPPTATPIPPTPTPRPDATIALSSRRVNWGDVITIRGEHFDASVPLTVTIKPMGSGDRKRDITPSPAPQTDNRGSFEFETIIPSHNWVDGTHRIEVYGGSHWVQVYVSIIVPSLSLSAYSGAVGSVLAVSGRDFSQGTFTVTVGGVDVTPSPFPSIDSRGRTEFDILIPGLAPGDYIVKLVKNEVHSRHSTFTVVSPPTPTPMPPPPLTLSSNSGAPGRFITLRGEGFKRWVPVNSASVGGIDVLPSPTPATDAQGNTVFDILIPGLEPGTYTVEIQASDATATVNFTVTDSDCTLATGTPRPTITLSRNSGVPGATITVRGTGFKQYVLVRRVDIGPIDITPSPDPHTNCDGETQFDILIPGLDSGRHTIAVQVSGATASTGFTVTSASNPTPTPRPTATPQPTQRPTATPRSTATPQPTPTPTPSPPIVIPVAPDSTTDPPQLPGGSSEPPHIFTGTATLNGRPAGTGIAIDAYDGGRLIGATVTQAGGRYTIHVHRSQGIITFRVNQQAAAESWTTWQQGQVTPGFNLTAAAGSSESDPSRLFAALPDLVRAFAFDNATKQWNFFDPVVPEVSTLTRFVPGNTYWLLVARTTELLLNGAERNLSCVGDNCWNLIVW